MGLKKHEYQQTSGGVSIPVELFQILKDDAVAVFIGRTDAEAPIIWPPDAESTHG